MMFWLVCLLLGTMVFVIILHPKDSWIGIVPMVGTFLMACGWWQQVNGYPGPTSDFMIQLEIWIVWIVFGAFVGLILRDAIERKGINFP